MLRLLARVVRAGTEGLDPREAKHVRLTNQISLMASALCLASFVDPRLAGRPALLAIAAATALGYALVPALSARGRHRTARLSLALGSIAWICADGLMMGADTEQHLFLCAVGTAAWFIMPRRERGLAAAVALLAFACMMALDQLAPARVAAHDPGLLHLTGADKATLFVMLQGLAYYAATQTGRAEAALDAERAKSDALLHNTLPRAIAQRLREQPGSIAERFDEATVLFADIVHFTQLSERVPATELVAMLDAVFTRFDALADQHGLEKIKTIGDAYMVVGGVPQPGPDHTARVAEMALQMQRVLDDLEGEAFRGLAIRVGIHTGPVVAGVIGRRKLVYDLWGDCVNTASRMESHGQPGRVHVSEEVQARLQGRYTFEDRGRIPIKGKGELRTFFLTGRA